MRVALILCLFHVAASAEPTEPELNRQFCASIGGQTEVRHYYTYPDGSGHVVVDCETESHVYESGLDKRSSLDSIQQVLFFAALAGKLPSVVIFDTDGREGRFEYRIKTACQQAGVRYEVYQSN